MRNLEVIREELSAAREALSLVEGTPTEVYSRIVGYYRSVRNWNKGKREEYKERKLFDPARSSSSSAGSAVFLPGRQTHAGTEQSHPQREEMTISEMTVSEIADCRVLLFVRASCPACPGAKTAAFKLGIPVDLVNADSEEGFAEAGKRQVMSTPTAIFLGRDGVELGRARNGAEITDLASEIAGFSAVKAESFASQAVSV